MSKSDRDTPARSVEPDESTDPADRIGTVIDDRYRLTELIGQGGMGAVYRGEHVTIRREVAVKLLHPQLVQIPELARRFEREAFAIGRIRHPNCVNVSDFGRIADGSLFLVMEYLEGETLGDLLDTEQRLPPTRALHIIGHVLRGLGHAHRAGIVHRDVKPDNVVIVEHDGDPDFAKVLDFGIAKLLGDAESDESPDEDKLTAAGITFGTPTYLSPEQAIGDSAEPASDLYSATVMLYEMLTGRPPFASDDKLDLLAMHAARPPAPLSDVMPHRPLPASLDAILMRGLAKKPAQRYANAEAYLAAVDACLLELGAPAPQRAATIESSANAIATAAAQHPRIDSLGGFETTPLPALGDLTGPTRAEAPRNAAWLAIAGVFAIVVIGAIAFETAGGDPVATSDVSIAAAESLSRGQPARTIELLEAQPDTIASDASAQLQLGHAYAHESKYEKAIEAYGKALGLEPSLIEDSALRANLELMSDDDGPVLVEAAGLLAVHADDDASRARVLELAVDRDPKVRGQAAVLAEALGLGEKVNRVASFTLDLRQAKTCDGKRAAIAKLRALGDLGAVPALEAAAAPTKRSGRRFRRRKASCVKAEAEDAIKYILSLHPGVALDD